MLCLLNWGVGSTVASTELRAYGAIVGDSQLMPGSAALTVELTLDVPITYYSRSFNSVFVSRRLID